MSKFIKWNAFGNTIEVLENADDSECLYYYWLGVFGNTIKVVGNIHEEE